MYNIQWLTCVFSSIQTELCYEVIHYVHMCWTAGEKFIESASKMATEKTTPELSVGGASISVAVEMGGVDGRYPEAMEVWSARERRLQQSMEWQSFRQNIEQVRTTYVHLLA